MRVRVFAWLRLRLCRCNSCSPARSPLARKPLLSHIFIGSLSALDYRVRREVPATCISSRSRRVYKIRNVGFRELGIWNIGSETSCRMFLFVRGWETRQKNSKTQYKKLLQNYSDTTSSYELQEKKKKKNLAWFYFSDLSWFLFSVVYGSKHLETEFDQQKANLVL